MRKKIGEMEETLLPSYTLYMYSTYTVANNLGTCFSLVLFMEISPNIQDKIDVILKQKGVV